MNTPCCDTGRPTTACPCCHGIGTHGTDARDHRFLCTTCFASGRIPTHNIDLLVIPGTCVSRLTYRAARILHHLTTR